MQQLLWHFSSSYVQAGERSRKFQQPNLLSSSSRLRCPFWSCNVRLTVDVVVFVSVLVGDCLTSHDCLHPRRVQPQCGGKTMMNIMNMCVAACLQNKHSQEHHEPLLGPEQQSSCRVTKQNDSSSLK